MWLKLKRALIFLGGAVGVVLGGGTCISAFTGSFGSRPWITLALALCGALLVALGLFACRVAVRGSEQDIRDTDLL